MKKPERPKTCTRCGSKRIAKIMYGMPACSSKLAKALAAGTISLGGCCVSDDNPKWECNDCGKTMGRQSGDSADEDAKLVMSIGGYVGPSYRLELKACELIYTRFSEECPDGETEIIVPSSGPWRRFWEFMQACDEEWDERYEDASILDGTRWSVEIATDEIRILTSGSNAYPENFEAFLEVVRALIGGRAFE